MRRAARVLGGLFTFLALWLVIVFQLVDTRSFISKPAMQVIQLVSRKAQKY
jgi:hypothetical protein